MKFIGAALGDDRDVGTCRAAKLRLLPVGEHLEFGNEVGIQTQQAGTVVAGIHARNPIDRQRVLIGSQAVRIVRVGVEARYRFQEVRKSSTGRRQIHDLIPRKNARPLGTDGL